jgi:uncharacterized membrane protein
MSHNRLIAIAALLVVVLSLPFYGRSWNLFMHIFGAVLFLGNMIVTAAWMSLARRSRSAEALRLGVQGVNFTDAIFTTPGALLLLINGGILSAPYFKTNWHWLAAGIVLFILSGAVWGMSVIPAQKKLAQAMTRMPAGGPIPAECDALLSKWFRFGGVATLLPLIALALMVFKPVF